MNKTLIRFIRKSMHKIKKTLHNIIPAVKNNCILIYNKTQTFYYNNNIYSNRKCKKNFERMLLICLCANPYIPFNCFNERTMRQDFFSVKFTVRVPLDLAAFALHKI